MIYPGTSSLSSLHLAISSDSLGFAGQTSQGWRQTLETVPNLDQPQTSGDAGGGGGGDGGGDGDGGGGGGGGDGDAGGGGSGGGYISGNVCICGDNEAIRTR